MDSMTLIALFGAALLVILGGLIGFSLSQQWLEREIRLGAALRREAGELRRDLNVVRLHCGGCPYCGENPAPLTPRRTGTTS